MDSTFITFQRLSVDEAIDHGVVDGLGDAVGVKFLKDAFTVAIIFAYIQKHRYECCRLLCL